jgi:hypothetical protein
VARSLWNGIWAAFEVPWSFFRDKQHTLRKWGGGGGLAFCYDLELQAINLIAPTGEWLRKICPRAFGLIILLYENLGKF